VQAKELLPTIQAGRFFFAEEASLLCATSGFYARCTGAGEIGEIGTTLVHPQYRGYGLQAAIYRYKIAQEWLSGNWPALGAYAIVDESAKGSWTNMDHCQFQRCLGTPASNLKLSSRAHHEIQRGAKRLYLVTPATVASALEFVASNGATARLRSPKSEAALLLSCKFPVFKNFNGEMALELQLEAARVRGLVQFAEAPSV
jgi:hypothetical protein